ncbi:hypothetical protein CUMW_275750 [Citrus unshiu]|uniref:t-SNARE coiled-coil homology domain-containing protein n=1 Tax=Citrus unshiu TaxID=55188 RepID=A0A2H5N054_CITUN|nr:hypothetical protein CUMW_275750 [Citrus unshiu]
MMLDFQFLMENILKDYKEGLKMKYYKMIGEEASFRDKEDLAMQTQQRQEALMEIPRSLTEFHLVLLDTAVLVVAQEEKMNDIEKNVAKRCAYINGGTNGLFCAEQMKKKRRIWAWCVVSFVLVLLFAWLISI